jgi:predicted DNA-binding transcriptional regulator AlpA
VNPLSATITIPAPAQPFLTADEVGRVIGCSSKTIMRSVQAGEFPPPIRVMGKPVWPSRVVAIWMAYQEVKPVGESAANDPENAE